MAERKSLYHLSHDIRNFLCRLLLGSLVMLVLAGSPAFGQAAQETARQRIYLRGYGMFSYVNPDFGGDTKNKGATVGGDIDGFRLLPRTELGMDARYTFSTGTVSNQYYFGGGPRLSLNLGAFRPYGDFIFGHGKGIFNQAVDPTYTHDETGALSYGGGFDYQLTRTWAVRADAQRQRWRFSIHQPYFYPVAVSVGVSYQFRFHTRTGPDL